MTWFTIIAAGICAYIAIAVLIGKRFETPDDNPWDSNLP
jgi:hypothetical protein